MEIELYSKIADPISAVERLGEMFYGSLMFGCTKPEQGKILALVCLAEKRSPIQIAREYHIIEGKLSDRADAMLAKFKAAGGSYKIITRTPDAAVIDLTHSNQTVRFSATWEELKKEPFVWMGDGKTEKKNWRTPRARMQSLWARVCSDGVRTLAPEIVSGIYTPEEIMDEVGIDRPAPSLNLAGEHPKPQPAAVASQPAPTPTPAPAPAPASKIVEAEVIRETPRTPEPAPVSQAAPDPAQPATPAAAAPAPQPDGLLPDEVVAQVENAIGEHAIAATKWMLAQGWLQPGQGLQHLPLPKANRIIKQREGFIRAITQTGGAK